MSSEGLSLLCLRDAVVVAGSRVGIVFGETGAELMRVASDGLRPERSVRAGEEAPVPVGGKAKALGVDETVAGVAGRVYHFRPYFMMAGKQIDRKSALTSRVRDCHQCCIAKSHGIKAL